MPPHLLHALSGLFRRSLTGAHSPRYAPRWVVATASNGIDSTFALTVFQCQARRQACPKATTHAQSTRAQR